MFTAYDEGSKYSADATELVRALQVTKEKGKKSLIRSTDHIVALEDSLAGSSSEDQSALVEEVEDKYGDDVQEQKRPDRNTGRNTLTLTSWKTQEFAYRKTTRIGCSETDELPTLARGLFTTSDLKGNHRIIVRGYDKFFNHGEMPWTKPESIAAYSSPPYELTFKENGCIIFIAALSPRQLIVTSKHSLGANETHAISHAQKGEEWLQRHLRSVGKKRSDLAQILWNRNETAVAELCDDSFEEHVLAYSAERSGLHLHGLNANTAKFQTRSSKEVEEFANQWGFLPTRYFVVNSIREVEKFTQSVAETGKWEGNAIEGFVVRTRMPSGVQDENGKAKGVVAPPYANDQMWFYKVKYDEPYLMYRDWRELTRRMMSEKASYEKAVESHPNITRPILPKVKNKRAETMLFTEWCYEQLHGSKDGKIPPHAELFAKLHLNQGIINLRNTFINYLSSEEGSARLQEWQGQKPRLSLNSTKTDFNKTLLIPIAIPGCGKTALAVALCYLFKDMSHTQSDNVQTKKTGPTFLRNVTKELDSHNVVFADRNNHLYKHREEIVKLVKEWEEAPEKARLKANGKLNGANATKESLPFESRRVRLIAIVWLIDHLPLNAVHHLCSDRLLIRGTNHQSLRADSSKEYENVLWHFIQTRQSFQQADICKEGECDDHFDEIITLDIQSNLLEMIQTCTKALAEILGRSLPSKEEITAAVEVAKKYQVEIKKEVKGVAAPTIRYYGLSVEVDLIKVLQPLLENEKEAKEALDQLSKSNRVISRPHVTLVHSNELRNKLSEVETTQIQIQYQQRWDYYSSLYQTSISPIEYTMTVDCIAWDIRAMSLGVASIINNEDGSDLSSLQGSDWRPHITIGTFDNDIRPFEGRRVLSEADAGSRNVSCMHFEQPLHISGRLQGLN